MWRHCWAKRLSYGKISATITATEPIRPSWRTFTWVTSILGYGRSPSMVIVGPSVRFELCNPDLSEISVTAQTRGKPLPGTRSIVAPHLCPMGTERGTPRCLHSWPDFWRIFNAAPLRMQVLDRALTT